MDQDRFGDLDTAVGADADPNGASFYLQEPYGALCRTVYTDARGLQWSKLLMSTLAELSQGYVLQGRSGMYPLIGGLYLHLAGVPAIVYVLGISAHVCGGYVSARWGSLCGFLSMGSALQERLPLLPVPTAIFHKSHPLADARFVMLLASLLCVALMSAAMLMLPEVAAGWVAHFTGYAGLLSFTAYYVGFRV